jgi:predicted kinase
MQGPPGSGKSSVAKYIASRDCRTVVVSTDDQCHAENGEYVFEGNRAAERHKRTQDKAAYLLRLGLNVVVDNTNIRAYECRPYVKAAVELGVMVEFVRCEGQFETVHGVPAERVAQMRAGMEDLTVEGVMESRAPWDTFIVGHQLAVGDTLDVMGGEGRVVEFLPHPGLHGQTARVAVYERGEDDRQSITVFDSQPLKKTEVGWSMSP